MTYPKPHKGTAMCIAVTNQGVRVYGNRDAFRSLAEWMTWLADAPVGEYYECHAAWQLESEGSFFGTVDKQVWVLFARQMAKLFDPEDGQQDFGLDFMTVEQEDLDRLKGYRLEGLLPEDWPESSSKQPGKGDG